MAVLSTAALIGLIVGGIALTSAAGATIWYAATEKDRIKETISQLENENSGLESFKGTVEYLKSELNKSITYLKDGRQVFTEGGHVDGGKPLANDEFTSCLVKLQQGVNSANNLIDDLNATIESNKKRISEENAKL